MRNLREIRKQEIIKIDKQINEYDEKKIEILRKVPLDKWKKIIYIFNEISEYYIVLSDLNEELKHSDITYKDIEERQEKTKEILGDIKEVKDKMKPYLEERNLILKGYLEKEDINELQTIYLQINSLERVKTDMVKLDMILKDSQSYEKK